MEQLAQAAVPEWAVYNVPSPHAQAHRWRCLMEVVAAAEPLEQAGCNAPSPRAQAHRWAQAPAWPPSLPSFDDLPAGRPAAVPRQKWPASLQRGGGEHGSCLRSFQRPNADHAHHAGMHVVEEVTVERPVAGRIGGEVQVDETTREHACGVL